MSIKTEILNAIVDALQDAMIDNIPISDTSRAGIVRRGSLQGDPDPSEARISVVIAENDPDKFYGKTGTSAMDSNWHDEVYEVEIGGVVTMRRRFTVKARCLLVDTQEELADTQEIADIVQSRIEDGLLAINWSGVQYGNEYVSRGCLSDTMFSEAIQAGGPTDAYDYHIKVRAEVLSTKGVIS